MENEDDLSKLEQLLSADINESTNTKPNKVKDVDLFTKVDDDEEVNKERSQGKCITDSVLHNGDTDSSDDEDRRNYMERKYNDYGTEVKKVLEGQENEQRDRKLEFETRLRQTNIDAKISKKSQVKPIPNNEPTKSPSVLELIKKSSDIYADPFFGIRIVKPILSSTAFSDSMQGRQAITMMQVKRHVEHGDLTQDWVIAGVIVRKSSSKKSQKGNNFLIWTLSDLKNDLKTISMFLFRKAYNDLWKTAEGTVVAVLNPNVLDKSENSMDQASLSIDSSECVMILGRSKDLGLCKSKKKNGEPCTAFVNVNQCEHCIYHVKNEYQKFSRRQELQSATMGKGLVNLQNKVLGKNTFIYGGKTFSAVPVSKNNNVARKDQNRLMSLSDYYKTESESLMTNHAPCGPGPLNTASRGLHCPTVNRASDSARLNQLSSQSLSPNIKSNSSLADIVSNSPRFGAKSFGLKGSGTIDLNMSYGQKVAERAKANAINIIKKSGGLEKINPNNTRGTEAGKKRAFDKLNGNEENNTKKLKVEDKNSKATMSDRFKKILEATSAHQNLIKQHEDEEQEKYFSKLEKKEAMEEKMLNTFKIACKAVRCVKCKYTSFSAAQRCKDEHHPLKVLDSFKRFFKCGNCSNRTVSLEIIPLTSCSNCSSSKWEKAPMLREKKVTTLSDGLSVRGEEETYIGGQVTNGKNINLLVPDSV